MKQVAITKVGGPDVLKIRELPNPVPQSNEVLIRVKAAGVNFADILARKGVYPDAPKLPCVVGYEVSGIVENVGESADKRLIGKPVLALTRFNGYSDVVTAPEIQVVVKPNSLSFEQAAAIPVNYLTAWQLLVAMGGLKKGESILIHNAGGGVGLAALDIARKIGATTFGTASSQKHDFLKSRGLDHAIDYRSQDWTEELKRLTDRKGVELIIDPIGGSHWKKSYKALRHTGRLGIFGISTVSTSSRNGKLQLLKIVFQTSKFHPFHFMNANRGVFGVNIGHLWHEGPKVRGWLDEIMAGVDQSWIRPHVDKTFPLEQAGDAHIYIEERRNIGKVILVP
ncbi:MAG: synaptic vesicle VAT-1 family membrane protein [Candidatus Zhuqueibacterota bacterium]